MLRGLTVVVIFFYYYFLSDKRVYISRGFFQFSLLFPSCFAYKYNLTNCEKFPQVLIKKTFKEIKNSIIIGQLGHAVCDLVGVFLINLFV